jgi:hypothetical protein
VPQVAQRNGEEGKWEEKRQRDNKPAGEAVRRSHRFQAPTAPFPSPVAEIAARYAQ